MIEKYDSYKESGIKWMGKIPSNWLLTKNRYGFKKHKGYPTKLHLDALESLGPCKIHRLSFRPVKNLINLDL